MHQTADVFRDGRKGSSILINLSFESTPLINTCKCSACCGFTAFTRETFWFKADLEGFPHPPKCGGSSNVHFVKSAFIVKAFIPQGKEVRA